MSHYRGTRFIFNCLILKIFLVCVRQRESSALYTCTTDVKINLSFKDTNLSYRDVNLQVLLIISIGILPANMSVLT